MGVSAQFMLWIWCKTLQSFQPHYLFEHRSTQKYHHQSFTHLTAIVHQQNTMRWLKQKISHYILKSKVNTIWFSFSFRCANPVLWCYEVSNICKSLNQWAQHSLVNVDCHTVLCLVDRLAECHTIVATERWKKIKWTQLKIDHSAYS